MNELLEKIPYDEINDLPQWQRLAAVGGVVLLIAGLYYFFLFADGQQDIARLKVNLEGLKKDIISAEQQKAKLPKLLTEIDLLEKDLKKVKKELPVDREIPYFLATVADEAKKAGLEVPLFQPVKEVKVKYYARIPVKIKVVGAFHDIMTFFDRVRRLPRIVDIENINMRIHRRSKKTIILQTSCIAVTYKYLEGSDKKKKP